MPKKSDKPRESRPEVNAEAAEATPKARKSRVKTKDAAAGADTGPVKPAKAAKARKAKLIITSESGEEVEIHVPVGKPFQHPGDDPVGDVTDGEAQFGSHAEPKPQEEADSEPLAEMAAHRADTADSAIDGTLESHAAPVEGSDAAPEASPEEAEATQEPARLNRLQKILSQAGIASRRRAEELITEGRVQVNGQVVTQLGAKADPSRDHIRVDGKLISGAERHRYFVLNKPKGYVTTVSDPEGRPTVMEFFARMSERLYPVGRLDYQSEGLLLVTNDGELANQLTRAASGVEKTYLVKVAGEPTEEALEQLRSGVAIDREGPGSGKVHTAQAQIRQVRRGDNPWFEVVLIEGRNRELRKMFSAVGHFVEKIRRVGYGPLVLDLEPGKFRELEPEELTALRLAAEGKWKPRRPKTAKIPAKDSGPRSEQRAFKPAARSTRPYREESGRHEKKDWKPREQRFGPRENRPGGAKPGFAKPGFAKPGFDRPQGRPRFEREGAGAPPEQRFGQRGERPRGAKPAFHKPGFSKPPQKKWTGERPRFDREEGESRPGGRSEGRGPGFRPQQREGEPRFEERADRGVRQYGERPYFKRPEFSRSEEQPKRFDRPSGKDFSKPRGARFEAKPSGPGRSDRPAREGRPSRPAREWGKDREQGPARFRAEQKPRFGGKSKPNAGGSRSSFSAKPGFKRSGPPRPGGKRPGGPKRG